MKSEEILVSIIINNYNYGSFLREAIESALAQTYSNTEVIVVDDGSTDNSREIISSYGAKVIPVFKENGGQASAFNAGFLASNGQIICFLDADDYYGAEKITKILEVFDKYPEAGWIFHDLEDVDANGLPLKEKRKRRINEFRFIDLREVVLKGKKLTYCFTATSGLCFKRNIIEQILPMPEQFFISSDSFVRFVAIYLSPGVLSPDRLAVHRCHGNNLYAFRKDLGVERAKLGIKSAYYLKHEFPEIQKFADNHFVSSFVQLIIATDSKESFDLPETQLYFKENSILTYQLKLWFKVGWIYLKNKIRQLLKSN